MNRFSAIISLFFSCLGFGQRDEDHDQVFDGPLYKYRALSTVSSSSSAERKANIQADVARSNIQNWIDHLPSLNAMVNPGSVDYGDIWSNPAQEGSSEIHAAFPTGPLDQLAEYLMEVKKFNDAAADYQNTNVGGDNEDEKVDESASSGSEVSTWGRARSGSSGEAERKNQELIEEVRQIRERVRALTPRERRRILRQRRRERVCRMIGKAKETIKGAFRARPQ